MYPLSSLFSQPSQQKREISSNIFIDFLFCSELRCMWHRLLCHSLVPSERYSANLTSRSPLLEERRGRALFDNLSFVVTIIFSNSYHHASKDDSIFWKYFLCDELFILWSSSVVSLTSASWNLLSFSTPLNLPLFISFCSLFTFFCLDAKESNKEKIKKEKIYSTFLSFALIEL